MSEPIDSGDSTRAGQSGAGGFDDAIRPAGTGGDPLGGGTTELPEVPDPAARPGPWVGRARPPASANPPPPVDPYWPPMEPVHYDPRQPPPLALVGPRRTGRGKFLLFVGVMAFVCGVGSLLLLLGGAVLRDMSTPDAAKPAPTTTKPAPPPPPGLGDAVRDGRFEFVVSKVNCGETKIAVGPFDRRAQGQFCVVSFSARNISTEAQNFSETFQKAIDKAGTAYASDIAAGLMVNQQGVSFWSSINPGDKISGKMVYDIPKEAKLVKLELHDSPFSDGATVTL